MKILNKVIRKINCMFIAAAFASAFFLPFPPQADAECFFETFQCEVKVDGKSYFYNEDDYFYNRNIPMLESFISRGRQAVELMIDNMQPKQAVDLMFYGFDSFLDKIIEENCVEVKNSGLVLNKARSGFDLTEEVAGRILDTDEFCFLFASSAANGQNYFETETAEVKPEIKKKNLEGKIGLISEFSTTLYGKTPARINNIKLALSNFNGLCIPARTEISFNMVTGPRTKERGYKEANIIINGDYEKGVGGGVCQASTTLYNALLLAGINIKEVHSHTLAPSYVELSFDAMVNTGSADLIFYNQYAAPIAFLTSVSGEKVNVKIFGKKLSEEQKIVRRSEIIEIIPPEERPDNPDETEQKPKLNGYKSEGYLDYYESGRLVKSVKIRSDKYKPR